MSELNCPFCGGPTKPACTKYSTFSCAQCLLEVRLPVPTTDEILEFYDQHYYDSWDDQRAPDTIPGYWDLKTALFRNLLNGCNSSRSSPRALDVGCATGACCEVMISKGWQATGLDINPTAIELADGFVPDVSTPE